MKLMEQEKLLAKLKKQVSQSEWPIVKKVFRLPFKVLLPKTLEKIHKSYPVIAHTFWGGKLQVMLPEVVSTYLYRFGFFDEEVCFYMIDSLKEGGTFIDIGAHFGSFSLLGNFLTGSTGQVISIDPTPSTFKLLSSNLSKFATFPTIETYNLALYDKEGHASFYDFGLSHSSYNSMFGSRNDDLTNSDKYKIQVRTRTLDSIVAEVNPKRIDFIKIDAESAELAILKGATETLKRFSPRVTVEMGDTGLDNAPKSIEIIKFLQSLDYAPFEYNGTELIAHTLRDSYLKNTLSCYNLLFVKK